MAEILETPSSAIAMHSFFHRAFVTHRKTFFEVLFVHHVLKTLKVEGNRGGWGGGKFEGPTVVSFSLQCVVWIVAPLPHHQFQNSRFSNRLLLVTERGRNNFRSSILLLSLWVGFNCARVTWISHSILKMTTALKCSPPVGMSVPSLMSTVVRSVLKTSTSSFCSPLWNYYPYLCDLHSRVLAECTCFGSTRYRWSLWPTTTG